MLLAGLGSGWLGLDGGWGLLPWAVGLAGLGWGRGWGAGGWGCWAGRLGLAGERLGETEIGLFENGKVCFYRKNEILYGQQQQAISIYFFLEGSGFRV